MKMKAMNVAFQLDSRRGLHYVHLNVYARMKDLISSLRDIRDKADAALRRMESAAEQRSLAWRCVARGHVTHFTRPATAGLVRSCYSIEPRAIHMDHLGR